VPGARKADRGNAWKTGSELSGFLLLLLHASCFLLVVCYVNMYQFWAWLSRMLGSGMTARLLPVIVTAAVLLIVSLRFVYRVNRGYRINLVFLGLGIVGAVLALAIPDPNVPIKRVHVAEYIVLSFLVRYTLSHRLQGASLTLFTILVTLLLGIHDEMLQGLHSLRYYGWRDILVNGTAGLSGALLGHGLLCFQRAGAADSGARPDIKRLALFIGMYTLLFAATVWLVISLYEQRGSQFPLFSLLPLAGVGLCIVCLAPEVVFHSRKHHGFQVVWWLAVTLLLYPLAANLIGIEFI